MNEDGVNLLREFEGVRLKAYIPVPGDVPTIGFGHTQGVKMADTCTLDQAVEWLKQDILIFENGVQDKCTVHANENELAAMTCLAYNIGLRNFANSTVLRSHNKGDIQAASRAFGLFNKSGGKVYAGLTRRRAAEGALYLKPVPETQADHPMPQSIDPETPVSTKPLSLLGGITTLGGLLGSASSVSDKAGDAVEKVGGMVDTAQKIKGGLVDAAGWAGFTPLEVGSILLILVGVAIVFFRWRQRNGGWA